MFCVYADWKLSLPVGAVLGVVSVGLSFWGLQSQSLLQAE